VGAPIFIPPPAEPTHPHRQLGMGVVFIGMFVVVIGTYDWANCSLNASGGCPSILVGVVAVLGVLLMIIGYALMLLTSKPEDPLVFYAPKP
jgi:uncharacterized membrane protein YidH (DUF202 family)